MSTEEAPAAVVAASLTNRQRRVLAHIALANEPHPATSRNIARWVNVSHTTVQHDLRPLKTGGLVEVAGHTRTAADIYRLTTAGAAVVRGER